MIYSLAYTMMSQLEVYPEQVWVIMGIQTGQLFLTKSGLAT